MNVTRLRPIPAPKTPPEAGNRDSVEINRGSWVFPDLYSRRARPCYIAADHTWISRMVRKPIRSYRRILRSRRVRYAFLSVLLLFIAVEVALRLIGHFMYQPIARESEVLNRPDSFSILCAGDSHTYGVDAPRGLSYPDQLENLLNANSATTGYVTANLGVPGYNSAQTLRQLRDAFDGSNGIPDLVIICVGGNNNHNFRYARFWEEELLGTESYRNQFRHLLEHSRAYHLGRITVWRITSTLRRNPEQVFDLVLWDREVLVDWLVGDYEEMIDLVRANGRGILFLNYYHYLPSVNESLRTVARTRGVPFVNVQWFRLPPVLGARLVGETSHPNEKGYAAIARFVHEGLLEQGLIPDSPSYRARTAPQEPAGSRDRPDAP